MLGFLNLDMRLYKIIILLIVFGYNFLNAQTNDDEGTKIDLNNVNVQVKALPTIFLFGKQYTFRERDNFIRGILKSKWFLKDLSISLDLEEFYIQTGFFDLIIREKLNSFLNQKSYLQIINTILFCRWSCIFRFKYYQTNFLY